MAQADVARFKLQRVNPFQGLMIDAATWRDAHEYHRNQMRLHQLALHGWGIAQGLEVTLDTAAENTVRVAPGIAVEPSGNFIVVSEPYVHHVAAREAGTIYLLLMFSEVPTGPVQPAGSNGAGQATRILEAYRIQQRDHLPDEPCLELARFRFQPDGGPIANPKDAANPGVNELDTGHRTSLGSAPVVLPDVDLASSTATATATPVSVAPVSVAPVEAAPPPPPPPPPPAPEPEPIPEPPAPVVEAQPPPPTGFTAGPAPFAAGGGTYAAGPSPFASMPASYPAGPPAPVAPPPEPPLVFALGAHSAAGADRHEDGLRYLAREVQHACGRKVDVRQGVALSNVDGVDFLYLSGHGRLALGPDDVEGLRRVLDRGGVVVGEGCASGPSGDAGAREFALSFAELASRLGRQLARVERGGALLDARFVFSGPPAGSRANMMVLESDGMIYSDADYGCAWQGGTAERPLPRGPIRDATEFGVNLALYRQRDR